MLKAVERVEKEQKKNPAAAGGEVNIADRIATAIGVRKAGDCSKGVILRTIDDRERRWHGCLAPQRCAPRLSRLKKASLRFLGWRKRLNGFRMWASRNVCRRRACSCVSWKRF